MFTFLKRILKGIKALLVGHLTVFKHIFKGKITLEYPEKRPILNDKFRGKHCLDKEKCAGCGICQNVCPSGAITILKEKNDEGKLIVKDYIIDLKKCIFCGNCQYYCTKGAIKLTKDFELATDDKNSLILHLIDDTSSIINDEEA